jgi:hypothetical protein
MGEKDKQTAQELGGLVWRGVRQLRRSFALKGSHLAEENVLPAGDNDFLSVWKQEDYAGRIQETRLFHVGEVDDTIARSAKKRGAIQPALAIPERAPDENRVVGQVDACMVAASFKKPNFRRLDQPALAVVAQKDEVIKTKCAIILSHRVGSVRLNGTENSICRRGWLFLGHLVPMRRDELSRSTTARIVQFHERSWASGLVNGRKA